MNNTPQISAIPHRFIRAKSLDEDHNTQLFHPLTRSHSNYEGALKIREGQLADIEALTKTIQALYDKFCEEHKETLKEFQDLEPMPYKLTPKEAIDKCETYKISHPYNLSPERLSPITEKKAKSSPTDHSELKHRIKKIEKQINEETTKYNKTLSGYEKLKGKHLTYLSMEIKNEHEKNES
jgi:hypothetical protein